MLPINVPAVHLMVFAFLSSFLLYFIDKYKKNDKKDIILALVTSSLIAFIMVQRLELTTLFLALFIAVLLAKKVDKSAFVAGLVITPILFLIYGAYDESDISALFKTYSSCNQKSCKWPLLLVLLTITFFLDEIMHDKYPKYFKSRLVFPFVTLLLLTLGIIEIEMFFIFIAFDLGYGLMNYSRIE
ncbi:MAG: hypothetical protein N3E37_01045 [Candidatus Micrarchaeota archaeon]|nr:hypothetical protein [Candidatus Micrarchaeota archaeon]